MSLQQSKSATEPELRPTHRPTGGANRQGMSNATVEATSKEADDLSRAKSHSVSLTLQDLCVLCLQCLLSSLQLSPAKVHLFGPLQQPVSFCCGCTGLVSLTLSQRIFLCLQRLLLLFIFCSTMKGVAVSGAILQDGSEINPAICNTLCIFHMTTDNY